MSLRHAHVDHAGRQAGADSHGGLGQNMNTETASAVSRREFLVSSGALLVTATSVGVTSLALGQSRIGPGDATAALQGPPPAQLDSWIAILPDGSAEAFFGKMDVGHGLEVAIAQIVSEELDVDVSRVVVHMGDTALTCNQGGASGSTGVSLGAKPLRNAAAEARRILLERAAAQLGVSSETLIVTDGVIAPQGDPGRRVTYAQLIGGRHFDTALEWNKAVGNFMDVKGHAEPKAPGAYRVVGQPIPRRDVAGKILGTADYVTDVRVPGMLHARMIRPPLPGSTIASVNADSIRNARVVREGEFLAVVAEREWDAVQAARTLAVKWTPPAAAPFPGDDALHDYIRAAPVTHREQPLEKGDPDAAFRAAARVVEAEYLWPLQSHASMGPACALADVKNGEATLWTGSQKPHSTRDGVAKLLGLPPEKVHGIWVVGPGSYGRNDAGDAALDAAGKVIAYEFISKGLSRTNVSFNESDPRDCLTGMTLGMPLNAQPALGSPGESYAFEAKRLAWEVVPALLERCSPLRTSHLRDPVGPEVHFGSEQFIDELAVAAGADPIEFRLRYITAARDAAVVKAAAEKAGWVPRKPAMHRASPRRAEVLHGQGIAYAQRGETVVAVVAHVEVYPKTGRIWARRFTVAHDCGLIINPQSLRQTIEGNIVQGLSRTLFEEVRFDRTSVHSVDWASYPILEIADAPESIDVVLIDHTELAPSGAGEPTIRCVPAAVANAFWDATGIRMRRVPLTPARVREALARV